MDKIIKLKDEVMHDFFATIESSRETHGQLYQISNVVRYMLPEIREEKDIQIK